MSELKTTPTDKDAHEFLNQVEHPTRKRDGLVIHDIMKEITGEEPVMWGPTIVGFGRYSYKYKSGKDGSMFLAGFSPRKSALTLYMMSGFDQEEELLSKLGKHKRSKACLYINKLEDVDIEVLREIIIQSVSAVKKKYPQ